MEQVLQCKIQFREIPCHPRKNTLLSLPVKPLHAALLPQLPPRLTPSTVRLFDQGLHNRPNHLRELLQAEVDAIQTGDCDALLLAYGLCGTAIQGLKTLHTPLVIPRAHDCITLYLGSRQRYQAEFTAHPGTFWYSLDYMEHNSDENTVALGASSQATLDCAYETYVQKFGQENADYLMEVMGSWQSHYTRAVYIHMDHNKDDTFESQARRDASHHGWVFERYQSDRRLLDQLIRGEWPEEDFLIVPPGFTIVPSLDPEKIMLAERTSDQI